MDSLSLNADSFSFITSCICIPQVADCELIFAWASVWLRSSISRGRHSCCRLCLLFFSEYAGLAWADAKWDIVVAGLLSCLLSVFPTCYQQLEIVPCVSVPSSVHTWKQILLSQKLSGLKWEERCAQGLSCLVVSWPHLRLSVGRPSCHLVLASTVSARSILRFFSVPRHCGQFWMPWSQQTG